MTHLPFIAGSYALAILTLGGLGAATWIRLNAARRLLAAIDPRQPTNPRPS
jgi:hypothetical protein